MVKYQKRKSYWKNQCDKIFAEIVKLKANGKCEETGTAQNIQCAHIIPRNYHSTRWDFDNAIALNFKRHKYYTHHPVEWREFINNKFGNGRNYYYMLERRALSLTHRSLLDYKELYARLEAVKEEFKKTGKITSNPGKAKEINEELNN